MKTVSHTRWPLAVAAAFFTTLVQPGFAAPAPASAPAEKKSSQAPAPGGQGTVKQVKEGEMEANIIGQRKDKLQVGKFDPPAAFNLEDIQNFPEDRLQPVLNNPITFEEGRDFSNMMDFQDDQLIHPWLAELANAPFLTMKTSIDKPAKDWTFAVIDQAGATVSKQQGTGAPPAVLSWDGQDQLRDHVAVDTVYIPQLATTDKEGYHHTYMGEPVQFSSIMFREKGRMVIELSAKRLFQEKKSEFSKEAPALLDKVCDAIREDNRLPFAIQPYDNDSELARSRQETLAKYFAEKLFIPENQIIMSNPGSADKRGAAMAILSNATPGGNQ